MGFWEDRNNSLNLIRDECFEILKRHMSASSLIKKKLNNKQLFVTLVNLLNVYVHSALKY